jgi:hypothetical protein
VVSRKYFWIIFGSSVASMACLLISYTHYVELGEARGWDLNSGWQWLALFPGGFCIIVWLFQTRPWLRAAGIVSTIGVLCYSVLSLMNALATQRLSGDMGFLVSLEGLFAVVVTVGWALVALLIGWLGGREGSISDEE